MHATATATCTHPPAPTSVVAEFATEEDLLVTLYTLLLDGDARIPVATAVAPKSDINVVARVAGRPATNVGLRLRALRSETRDERRFGYVRLRDAMDAAAVNAATQRLSRSTSVPAAA